MIETLTEKCSPIIKWAGGKRQILDLLLDMAPVNYNTYFEPFFGGGALFLALNPIKSVINDSNKQLINMYKHMINYTEVIKIIDEYQEKYNNLNSLDEKKAFYYEIRNEFNKGIKENILNSKMAAIFIVLNKSCFNGMYRVNKDGLYNVPTGKKERINCYSIKNIKNVSKALSKSTILCGDFKVACASAEKNDFVFFDSPYFDTFDTYQAGGFSEENHIELFNLYTDLTNKGVYCMLTNSNCSFIKDLYRDFHIKVIPVSRKINCDKNKRTGEEVIITNFKK